MEHSEFLVLAAAPEENHYLNDTVSQLHFLTDKDWGRLLKRQLPFHRLQGEEQEDSEVTRKRKKKAYKEEEKEGSELYKGEEKVG